MEENLRAFIQGELKKCEKIFEEAFPGNDEPLLFFTDGAESAFKKILKFLDEQKP